jgi:hypothetical protein
MVHLQVLLGILEQLELLAAHTLAKLLSHVNRTLSSFDILKENQFGSDSLTVLYWLANNSIIIIKRFIKIK